MQTKILKKEVGLLFLPLICLFISGCIPTGGGNGDVSIAFRNINSSVTASGTTIGIGKMKEVDLNGDGTNDVEMTAFYSYFAGKSFKGINGTDLYVNSDTVVFFAANQIINQTSTPAIDNTVYSNATQTGYIGYRISLPDGAHYGWFKVSGQFTNLNPIVSVTATILNTGYKKPTDTEIGAGKH